jgi:uncharacterized membrane protein
MKPYLAAYAGTFTVMIALDLLWLGVVAKPLYQKGLGALMLEQPNWPVAALFYASFAVGLVIFGVAPQEAGRSWARTLGMAALFGFFCYATYDLTNLATLKGWPLGLSIMDMAWGTVVSTLSVAGGKAAMDWAARS